MAIIISTLKPVSTLYIPRFDQKIEVFQADQVGRTWDISIAGVNNAAQLDTDNIVIAGHRDWNNQQGVFYNLDNLEIADFVYYSANGETYLYQVVETKVIDDNDLSILDYGNDYLVLFTCEPAGYPYTRYVVIAEFRSKTYCAEQGQIPTAQRCE